MKIAIIIAMEEEFEAIKPLLNNHIEEQYFIKTFKSQYKTLEIITLISGIGKVNSAIATTFAIQNYKVDFIINIGSCGGINGATVGSFVISNQACYSDVNVTAFGYKLGQIPGMPEIYSSKSDIISLDEIILSLTKKYIINQGVILTSDQFINSKEKVQDLKSCFKNSIAIEMEASAIAQCCYKFSKSYLFIKKVSDMADDDAQADFSSEILKMNENTTNLVDTILSKLAEK